jgi:hypothetical protein
MFPFDENVLKVLVYCYLLMYIAGAVLIIAALACVYIWLYRGR